MPTRRTSMSPGKQINPGGCCAAAHARPKEQQRCDFATGSERQRPESPITRGPILVAVRPLACIPPRMVGAVALPVVVAVVPTPFPPTILLPTPLLLRLCFALLLPVITSLCLMSCLVAREVSLKVGLGNRPMSTVVMRRLLMNLRLNFGRLTAGAAVATLRLPLLLVAFLLWRPLRRRKVSRIARGTMQTRRRRGLSTRKFGRNWMLHG